MKRLLILLLLAAPLHAQAIQTKICQRDANWHAMPCTFDNPVFAGDLLVAVGKGGGTVSDSQGNIWQTAINVPYYNSVPLWYVLSAKGGIDPVWASDTVYFDTLTQFSIIAEYPPSTGLEDANYGTYAGQNVHVPQGESYDDHVTMPVETEEYGELLIAWDFLGSIDGPWKPTAGPNFTLRTYIYGALALEDLITTIPGLYVGAMKWNNAAHWVMGVAAFKLKPTGCKT
jgi:hypothetical protein